MLTHVDICTALWDYALGHISCNDENDDGDEDSGEGGVASIFCPCLVFNINVCNRNWMCAQKCGRNKFWVAFEGLLSSSLFNYKDQHMIVDHMISQLLIPTCFVAFSSWMFLFSCLILMKRQEVTGSFFFTSLLNRENVF